MTPVMQTTFHPRGDCLTAAVASLLDLPIEDVPRFIDKKNFWGSFMKFLRQHNYEYSGLRNFRRKDIKVPTIGGFYLVSGKSQRGCLHVCVYKDGQMIHDPHPSNTGLVTEDHVFMINKMEKEPYMPSNGTEGMAWEEKWCDRCSRRALDPSAKTQCIHHLRALAGEDNKRWYYIDGVPTCTAFRDRSLKKRYRKKPDKRQAALFTQPPLALNE